MLAWEHNNYVLYIKINFTILKPLGMKKLYLSLSAQYFSNGNAPRPLDRESCSPADDRFRIAIAESYFILHIKKKITLFLQCPSVHLLRIMFRFLFSHRSSHTRNVNLGHVSVYYNNMYLLHRFIYKHRVASNI